MAELERSPFDYNALIIFMADLLCFIVSLIWTEKLFLGNA